MARVHDAGADVTEVGSGGRRSPGGAAMTTDTVFVVASCTKPNGGVLALGLVELGILDLDGPISRWLPEFRAPRVLVAPGAALAQTVPAQAPITLRHLLTITPGFGRFAEPGPLADAMQDASLAPGPFPSAMDPDTYAERLGALPLADQPGTTFRSTRAATYSARC